MATTYGSGTSTPYQQAYSPNDPYAPASNQFSTVSFGGDAGRTVLGTTDVATGIYAPAPQVLGTSDIDAGGGSTGGVKTTGGGNITQQTIGQIGDSSIELTKQREAEQLAALNNARETSVAGVEQGYNQGIQQYALGKQQLQEQTQLTVDSMNESQRLLEEKGAISLTRLQQDIEKYRGQSTREAEIARVQARKMASDAVTQARQTARALGASASSDFMNILSEVENWALGQQGEISTGLLQAMDEYNLQNIRAEENFNMFVNEERAKTNQAVSQLKMDRDHRLQQIAQAEEMSLEQKNQAIREINSNNEVMIAQIMTEFTDKMQGIERWRTELTLSMQEAAANRAAALSSQQSPLELASAEAAEMFANGVSATEVQQIIGTKYNSTVANEVIGKYTSVGGTSPEGESRLSSAYGFLGTTRDLDGNIIQGIQREEYVPPSTSKYKPSWLESPFLQKQAEGAKYGAYGPVGMIGSAIGGAYRR